LSRRKKNGINSPDTSEASTEKSQIQRRTRQKKEINVVLSALNKEQKELIQTIKSNTITFVKGSAGVGKTYLSVSLGLQGILSNEYENLIFSRPVVEANGEKLGFLPGDLDAKISPFMMPIFYSLEKIAHKSLLRQLMNKNNCKPKIKVIPLAYLRGVTLDNSFAVLDEAQNSTPEQVLMFLTRIGKDSKMVLCGDVQQSDIKTRNGLQDAFERLQNINGIGFVSLSEKAIVRNEIIKLIEQRYSCDIVNENKHQEHKV